MTRGTAKAMLVVLAVGAVGCRATRPPSPPPATAEAAGQSPKRAPLQRPAPQAGVPLIPPESPWFPPQDWSERRVPEDFRIGALNAGGGEAAYEKLEQVCQGLVKGKIETAALDPTRAEGLSEILSGQLERGARPAEYRIGRLELVSDAAARARIRFSSASGSVEGEAYLVRLLEGWFVSDLQIDLSSPGPRGSEPFLPSPYRGRTE